MPLPYAPPSVAPSYLPPLRSPITAPGVSAPVPFVRPGSPPVAPIRPPLPPPLPVLPPLAAPTVAPAAGGLARAAPIGAALLGAAALGLAIGNAVYEEVLDRPFGPSLGDLFLPQGQPLPLPVPEPQPVPGSCPVPYYVFSGTKILNPHTGQRDDSQTQTGNVINGPFDGVFGPFDQGNALVWYLRGPNIPSTAYPAYYFFNGWIDPEYYFRVVRVDGLADDCSPLNPEPLPEPQAQPRPTLPRPDELPRFPRLPRLPVPDPEPLPPRLPRLPEFPLPGLVPDELPDGQRLPSRLPSTLPFPFPNLFPEALPEPELEPRRRPDGTPIRPRPPTPTLECCPSLELKLDLALERPTPEECDLTGVEELLRQVLEKLAGEGTGTLDLTPCIAEESVGMEYQGTGLSGVYSAIQAITESLNLIHTDTKCPPEDCVVAVPDWWQMRPGANRPQLSVIFRKGEGRNYHAINIPHPKVDPVPTASPIGPYTAGNFQATIVLIDNSKFIVNAVTAAEANRVALEAAQAIRPIMLGSELKISITERRGYPVTIDVMQPRYMQFFPEGQQSRMPVWRVPLAQ